MPTMSYCSRQRPACSMTPGKKEPSLSTDPSTNATSSIAAAG
jgi:hypothetical protein